MTRTYELRTPIGKRPHMTFETEDAARRRMEQVANRLPLELVEVITTRQERVIQEAHNG